MKIPNLFFRLRMIKKNPPRVQRIKNSKMICLDRCLVLAEGNSVPLYTLHRAGKNTALLGWVFTLVSLQRYKKFYS